MDLGALEKRTLEMMKMPLSEQEETILELLRKVNRLEYENGNLRDEIKQLKWSIVEHD